MIKQPMVSILAATVLLSSVFTSPVSAKPGKDLKIIPVIVNGQKVRFPDTEPYINTDGRTMVPVRFVSEKLGAKVDWEPDTETAVIRYGEKEIHMPVGSTMVEVNGESVELDTAAEKYDGRTMVPLRFVSEVMASKVEWDEDAHAVKVTDTAYQAKIDAGEVTLDPWGREYSKKQDEYWMRLTDLESTKFYSFYKNSPSRAFLEPRYYDDVVVRLHSDSMAQKIRNYYEAQLNIDYRTVDAEQFAKKFIENSYMIDDLFRVGQQKALIKDYVAWVKKNKVIAKGYADPELSTLYRSGDLMWVPTRFKFMIISAEDTSQTFFDNYNVSEVADSFKLKKGIWYDGYSEVSMTSNVANQAWGRYYGIRHGENMFYKNSYFYNITTNQ
ncbi:copper amine oxidase N-terminal domain-containing protein [Cohnella sp. GCM10027633]|uniref:copper amine oxidase N-terminal domain-containing protein n=1 Tax=unclassified Cohnella TaxID=2636738 RepID=UPI0036269624